MAPPPKAAEQKDPLYAAVTKAAERKESARRGQIVRAGLLVAWAALVLLLSATRWFGWLGVLHALVGLLAATAFWVDGRGTFAREMYMAVYLLGAFILVRTSYLGYDAFWRHDTPCGASSCSSDWNAFSYDPATVYNPRGWFPSGEHRFYNTTGEARYTFCHYGDRCRWADYSAEPIVTYERLEGGCQLDLIPSATNPRLDERGFISHNAADYPLPAGKGVAGAATDCRRADTAPGIAACPGNYQQQTQAGENYYRGKQVCATCALYANTIQSFLGTGAADGAHPQWYDPEVECQAGAYGPQVTNPFCAFCPGASGWFGLPGHEETVHEGDFVGILVLTSLGMMVTFLGCHLHYWELKPEKKPAPADGAPAAAPRVALRLPGYRSAHRPWPRYR